MMKKKKKKSFNCDIRNTSEKPEKKNKRKENEFIDKS